MMLWAVFNSFLCIPVSELPGKQFYLTKACIGRDGSYHKSEISLQSSQLRPAVQCSLWDHGLRLIRRAKHCAVVVSLH